MIWHATTTIDCISCGGTLGYFTIGVGPHVGAVRCYGCDRHIRWIRAAELPMSIGLTTDAPATSQQDDLF